MEFVKTLLIACIPAIITGVISYFVARKNASAQIKVVEEQNKHDLEKLMKQNEHDLKKLMKQHEIDIENLKEAHKLDMQKMEQDHKNKLELQKKEFENQLLKQEKEGQNTVATEAVKGIFGMFGSAMDAAMNTPEGQQMLNDSIKNSQKNKEEE